MISIKKLHSTIYEVTVQGNTTTTHKVTLEEAYYVKLTGKKVSPEKLIEESFEFLLQRESNTSILRSFELPVIKSYFPNYEATIKQSIF
ncbi:MAG: hypothetical protein HQK84_10485 [Nitrospinae bacterium]|nr:hypothetical protein [Nitrospinota bacterium]